MAFVRRVHPQCPKTSRQTHQTTDVYHPPPTHLQAARRTIGKPLTKKEVRCLLHRPGFWKSGGSPSQSCLIVDARWHETFGPQLRLLSASGTRTWHKFHADRNDQFDKFKDVTTIKAAIMRQREYALALAASLATGAPGPPPPEEPTIRTLLAKRADRFRPQAWGAWHRGLHEQVALLRTERPTRKCSSSKRRRDPLPTLLADAWPPLARKRFLREEALREAFVAASKKRKSKSDVYTNTDLFDEPRVELGGRTRFGAFRLLCQGMELSEVVFVLRGRSSATARAGKFLTETCPAKTSKSGPGSAPGSGMRRGRELRDERLLGRALTQLCESFLENDRLFGGGAGVGHTLDVALIAEDGRRSDDTSHVMVVEVHNRDALVDVAVMFALPVPVRAAGAAPSQQHAFTGDVRRLDLRDFAMAREAAATGEAGRGGGDGSGLFGGQAVRGSNGVTRLSSNITPVDKPGVYGEEGFKFQVWDGARRFVEQHIEKLCRVVDVYANCDRRSDGSPRPPGGPVRSFAAECTVCPTHTPGSHAALVNTRAVGGLKGNSGASCNVNTIEKPEHMWAKAGCPERTNRPIHYKRFWAGPGEERAEDEAQRSPGAADAADAADAASSSRDAARRPPGRERLFEDPTYKELLKQLQTLVSERYPGLVELLLEIVPQEWRPAEGLIWNQCAMTGGVSEGHCEKHVDRQNLVNGFFYFTAGEVKGGQTVMFKRGSRDEIVLAIEFRNGRCVLGPFNRVLHGSTPFTGGRACLGAYVDRRIVKSCLAFRWNEETREWETRGEDEYARLKERYDALAREHGL